MPTRYWVETLGCPKNQVDSDKLVGTLEADGLVAAATPEDADVVVVNTCAFIEAARQESIDTVLALGETHAPFGKGGRYGFQGRVPTRQSNASSRRSSGVAYRF